MRSILSRIILFVYASKIVCTLAQFQESYLLSNPPTDFLRNSCNVWRAITEYGSSTAGISESSCFCELQGDDLDGDLYKWLEIDGMPQEMCENVIRSGEVEILPNNLIIEGSKLRLQPNNEWDHLMSQNKIRDTASQVRNPLSRRLQGQPTTRSVLVLRGKAADEEVTKSQTEISDDIFGTNNDPMNMKSQFAACSYGQLVFSPVSSSLISNSSPGVYTVTISDNITDVDRNAVRNAMLNQAVSDFGVVLSSIADHIMCCLPPGTAGSWLAYAFVNGDISVYNDDWCSYPSAQMHELGHNLNLAHSAAPPYSNVNSEYQDQSGLMGYSYTQDDTPLMCFNGAKTYQLGWFSSFHQDIYSTNNPISWSGNITGFVDKTLAQNDGYKMIIRLIDAGSDDYYVHYNRKSGFNDGTYAGSDLVLIASKQNSDGASYGLSYLTAELGAGQNYTIDDFGGKGVVISVNSIAGSIASVTIQSSDTTPSSMPSLLPTSNPSSHPSLAPSNLPSSSPSQLPSATPSFSPSRFPSLSPSSAPSDTPSLSPSLRPPISPSTVPSLSPSINPSNFPSDDNPSSVPSNYPSYDPSQSPSSAPSPSPSNFPSLLPSSNPSDTSSISPSLGPSSSPSEEPSLSPSKIPSGSPSSLPSDSPSLDPSKSPSEVPSSAPSPITSQLPSISPSLVPSDIPSISPSSGPSKSPSIVPSYLPSSHPSDLVSALPSRVTSLLPSSNPSNVNSTPSPPGSPSGIPSESLSLEPTLITSNSPTFVPSSLPSRLPSSSPSFASELPTNIPSSMPSRLPSGLPTSTLTSLPSLPPSSKPSTSQSSKPSGLPSNLPSSSPITIPSTTPSSIPSVASEVPTARSSSTPSQFPSDAPTLFPSSLPSSSPSSEPSTSPSSNSSFLPSNIPSSPPTMIPSKTPSQNPSFASEIPTATSSSIPSRFPSDAPSFFATGLPSSSPSFTPPSSLPVEPPSRHPTKSPSSSPSMEKKTGWGFKFPVSIPRPSKFYGPRPADKPWNFNLGNKGSFNFNGGFSGHWSGNGQGFGGIWSGRNSQGFGKSQVEESPFEGSDGFGGDGLSGF